ncbi:MULTISPECIES: hypothetical protein [unclassified Microcoleus]|jgi:hypothetical protein|uniref:hypothetical protein n=1 Tax=unclassified Microcoleus TaxID=2642155 RepID=UPI002FCFB8FD
MNTLVKNYCVMVEFPDVSGAEHLEMLQLRDELAKVESQLSEEEKGLLANADRRLVEQAREFYEELSRFVDLMQKRKFEEITPQRWWWYLDVLALLPNLRKQELTSGVV